MALTQVDQGLLGQYAQYTGFKNRIINGAMAISQRGTSFTLVSGTTQYTLDRWYANTTGGAGVVAQTGAAGSYAMQITGASGVSSCFFGQKIESKNIADAASSTVTYSITLSSSTLTSITWYARYPTAVDNYAGVTDIANGTLTINSTPTQYTFSISLPANAVNGLEVFFLTGSFTSGTLVIKNAQLEKGSTATSFDYRPYSTELALCCRYYQIAAFMGVAANTGEMGLGGGFPVYMRATPSMNTQVTSGVDGLGLGNTLTRIGTGSATVGPATTTFGSVRGIYNMYCSGLVSGAIYVGSTTVSAEL